MNSYQNNYKGRWRLRLAYIRKLFLRWSWFVALSIILATYLPSIILDMQSVSGYKAELQIQVELLGSNGVNNLDAATSFFANILVNPDTLSLALPKLNKLSQFKSVQPNDLSSLVSAQSVK